MGKCSHKLEVFTECPLCRIKQLEDENKLYKELLRRWRVVRNPSNTTLGLLRQDTKKALEGKF